MNELELMTVGWYIKNFLIGLVLWLPYTIIVFIIPIVGWLLIPTIPFFPFFYPFIKRYNDQRNLRKQKQRAIEDAQFANLPKSA